jgi:hypothetical protein
MIVKKKEVSEHKKSSLARQDNKIVVPGRRTQLFSKG